jgi:hypothetical protein
VITEYLIGMWGSFIGWVGGLIQLPQPPDFFNQLAGWAAQATTYVANTGVWVPWALVSGIIAVWAASLLAALTIKVVRIVLSFFTAGGGSAA